jgi:hypothetical protein
MTMIEFSAVPRLCSASAVSHSALGGGLARPAYCAPLQLFRGYCNIASRWGNGDSAACRRGAPIVCEWELSTPRADVLSGAGCQQCSGPAYAPISFTTCGQTSPSQYRSYLPSMSKFPCTVFLYCNVSFQFSMLC